MESKIAICSRLIAKKGFTISFAESATAGWLCSEFALTEQSGQVLKGGLACYDASLKVSLLGVPQGLIDQFTPESMEVTREMAYRLRNLIPADIYVTVTGLTTPGGSETPDKPVGTMFVFCFGKWSSNELPESFLWLLRGNYPANNLCYCGVAHRRIKFMKSNGDSAMFLCALLLKVSTILIYW